MSSPVNGANRSSGRYATLLVAELEKTSRDQQPFFLAFTLAYLVSLHIKIRVPLAPSAIHLADSIFDQIIRGHSLASKGILYVSVSNDSEVREIAFGSTLVIAMAHQYPEGACHPVPLARIECAEQACRVILHDIERIKDENLRGVLVGCAQLINLQAGGLLSAGHFSLSW
jgi:hypothetical protein